MVKAVCTGHCNEAKPMFPITSYLMLAWRTLAKRNSSTLENSSVAFKNVCFIKNCDASISEHELQISILPASGSFEISKDNEIILTGNVKMVENINNLKVSLPHIYTKEHTMTTEDIYENLTKRGYREDSYRCIKSSDLKSETGYIIWNDWLSFLDVMFQFDAIGRNANDFLLPKYIDTIIIDTKAQDTAILRGEDLPIFNHKTMKVIAAGGVQICGTKWEIIHRNLKLQEWQATNCKLETMDETRKELEHAHLEVSRPGDLTSLRWVESESPALLPTPRDEVCQVYYVGLNCQDLELAYGKPASEDQESKRQTHLGVEFSGLSASGRRVMGIVQRGLATTVLADNRYLWEVPPNWSLASASTVPVAYCTAYYALVLRGQLKPKQTVVVYHGASDIGLAAIRLALHMNCKVYTTYENREQMCYLISCFLEVPLKNTGQHWDPTFEKMVLQRTGGRGADVVLNQLGADKMAAALGCLAHNGTLLNIGDNYSNCTNLPQLSNNKSIHSIDMSSITEDERLQVANLLSEGIKWGHVYPIEHNCYSNHLGDFREAFEKLSRSDCIGKVIVRYECSGNKSTDRN